MTRSLYRSLLWLHPPAFRRQFGGEMLWIFDEATLGEGSARLLLDGLTSLLRQWFVGCGGWKILAGLAGGFLQLLLFTLVPLSERRAADIALPRSIGSYDLDFSRALALLIIVLVLSTAALSVAGRRRARRG